MIVQPVVSDIATPRLRLVSLPARFIAEALRGDVRGASQAAGFRLPHDWPALDDRRWLEMRLEQLRQDPSVQPWLLRAMVHAASGEMIGHIGFHGAPVGGLAELGYTVFSPHRRQGYALEAATAMLAWANSSHEVRRFRLSISPRNHASLAMATKMGFARVGEQLDDEDGLEYVFELVL